MFHQDILTVIKLVLLHYPPPLAGGLNNLTLVKILSLIIFYIFALDDNIAFHQLFFSILVY